MGSAEGEILRILADNRKRATRLRTLLDSSAFTCLEIGLGPLGVGVIGFLPEIGWRIGMDPLPPVELRCEEPIRQLVDALRKPICRFAGSGEAIPLGDGSVEVVVCCNVLDHVRDVEAVLSEIRRVLKPRGLLFLEVDTFSLGGLLKWYCWTKHLHANEILVRAHTYRFLERDVADRLRAHSFSITRQCGHTRLGAFLGKSRVSEFLAIRQ